MHKAALQQQVTQLIGQDELGQAAELLAKYWQTQHEPLYQATLAQIRRLHTLEQKQLKGLVSEDNANVEHARITDALLHLNSQLQNDRPEIPEELEDLKPQPAGWPKWAFFAGLIAIAAVVSLIWATSMYSEESDFFNLTLNVQELRDTKPISRGQIKIILGDHHFEAKDLNSDGQVIFTDIPVKYLEDSLQVIPVDLPFSVGNQSAVFPKESKNITINMISKPELTVWSGRVIDNKGRMVSGAVIDIGAGSAITTSDSLGNFRVNVPRPNNSSERVVARIDGFVRNDQRRTISKDEPATIIINDPK